jgi:UDPglucose--hexose-1-phosphate uridylyltransferase
VALVPFWAIWPYETMIISKRHLTKLPILQNEVALCSVLKQLTIKYDNLLRPHFPIRLGSPGSN